jgi:hypothetical protein
MLRDPAARRVAAQAQGIEEAHVKEALASALLACCWYAATDGRALFVPQMLADGRRRG